MYLVSKYEGLLKTESKTVLNLEKVMFYNQIQNFNMTLYYLHL